ncbi:MAG TPA: hypothetical protein DD383_01295 [Rikenellaceae bacterium]|nr:hypothetical protein [Rikenellaceae bacterium]
MKKVLKYSAITALSFLALASCEEIENYQTTIDAAPKLVYLNLKGSNTVEGKILHEKGTGTSSDFSAAFKVCSTVASNKGYSVNVSVDNSLIAPYNEVHKTSYEPMPSANIDLQNTSMEIAAGDIATPEEVKITLKGDLSVLNDENGYLIPITVKSSNAATSESRGTVYAVIIPETKLIKSIKSAEEVSGSLVENRSSWSADCNDGASLFDGDIYSGAFFNSSGNVLTVNLAGKHSVTGLKLNTFKLNNVGVEFSLDGVSWKSAGTAAPGDTYFSTSFDDEPGDCYVAFVGYLEASYIRLTFDYAMDYEYYNMMMEFYIYEETIQNK